MEPVLDCCAGMDVHEKKVDVCIAHGPLEKSPKFEIRTFSTMTSGLEDLKSWLKKYKVTTILSVLELLTIFPYTLKLINSE